MSKAISFADQLVSEISDLVESIHCSYVILPPSQVPSVGVGGYGMPATSIPTRRFIDNLGPMFSYLTAHSYLWMKGYEKPRDLQLYMDAFRSRHTKAWDMITKALAPRVFMRGDECNPFISCADIVAFLTDVKLYKARLRLEPHDIMKVWGGYGFETTVHFFDGRSMPYYTWKSDDMIDFSRYLARPVVFLAVDDIESNLRDEPDSGDGEPVDHMDADPRRPRRFNRVIKESDVYHGALRYASDRSGCVKIFNRREDMGLVRDGDVFVYVGARSKEIGGSLRDAFDISVVSGLEIRRASKVEKGK